MRMCLGSACFVWGHHLNHINTTSRRVSTGVGFVADKEVQETTLPYCFFVCLFVVVVFFFFLFFFLGGGGGGVMLAMLGALTLPVGQLFCTSHCLFHYLNDLLPLSVLCALVRVKLNS